ncbi:condensation domain-containing protein [Nocardia tengchongensis]|uniref:condensation domain-containing protein n=1 Tax=Nocardia tengchongensis TaxID=2055889 RepID=UPI00369D8CF6
MDAIRRSFFGQLLTAAVESAGGAVAVSVDATGNSADAVELTYRELDERSSRLARELIVLGIGPGDVVAMGITRSVESVSSLWAIAKTGATYLPLDPTAPRDRIEHLLIASGAKFGVTLAVYRAGLGTAAYWIELDDPARSDRIAAHGAHPISDAEWVRPLTEEHPACIICVPGATGKPENVAITHAELAARLESRAGNEDSRTTEPTTMSVAASIVEMLYACTTGARLIVAPPIVHHDRESVGELEFHTERQRLRPTGLTGAGADLRERRERAPLSPAQQRLWTLDQTDPRSRGHNTTMVVRLTGGLDTTALARAVADVLTRHEVLRTRYPVSSGVPYQEVLSVAEVAPRGLELERVLDIGARVRALAGTEFDVAQQVPICLRLLAGEAPDDYLLILVAHHIAADRGSFVPLLLDLMTAYTSRAAGAAPDWSPLPLQYTEFARRQHAVIGSGADENSVAAAQLAYWRDRLAGLPVREHLPLDRPRPAVPSRAGAVVDYVVPGEIHAALLGLARRHGTALFTVMHAAVAVLLARMSDETDITVGGVVTGRGEPALDGLVGLFANTVALRTVVDPATSFDDLVAAAGEAGRSAFAHADVPFERVVEAVAPGRGPAHPVLQVVLDPGSGEAVELELPGLTVTGVDAELAAADFDLRISAQPCPGADATGDLVVVFFYATELFDEATIEALGARLLRVLAAVAADPRLRVCDIDVLNPAERARALLAPVAAAMTVPVAEGFPMSGRTVAGPGNGVILPQSLSLTVEDDPGGPAFVQGETAVSYGELDVRSSRLARYLIGHGCGPGTGVAVRLDRGVELAVATWAVLKAGAAVLPLSALDRLPPSGLDVKVGLTTGKPIAVPGMDWLALDDSAVAAEISTASGRPVTYAHRTRALRGGDTAFAAPGRAPLSYDAVAALVDRIRREAELTFESRTHRITSADHPFAALEVIAAGGVGASMVLAGSGADLADTLAEEWVTHLFADGAGPGGLRTAELDDLRAVVVDAVADPSRWPGTTVVALPELAGPRIAW